MADLAPQHLTASLADLVAAAPGRLSVVVADGAGVLAEVDGERVVAAASTIKVPILVAVLRLVARGDLGLADSVQLGDDRVGGSGPLAALASVTQLQVGELLDLMITLSDNDATNALLDLVGVGAGGPTVSGSGDGPDLVAAAADGCGGGTGGPGQHHLRGRPGPGAGAAAPR